MEVSHLKEKKIRLDLDISTAMLNKQYHQATWRDLEGTVTHSHALC
jgi:hypothetical protein